MDILTTLPSRIDWADYEKELQDVEKKGLVMNFRVPSLPARCSKGDRCYLVHRGEIVGWMMICGFQLGAFKCQTTGREWPEGNYVQRSGPFHRLKKKIPYKGFQGFRYLDNDLEEILRDAQKGVDN